ncbi:4-hydroxyphenylacetate 3-hydroxylase N-terminal domain-containing protein [Pseudoruegeria sp. HB172150]|uniref:4-hydroxyphenylacetate 3-hydroxylase N-terminal domain-containing protein n=1 Tax=Pseudoruegeria sp. HB172150 TaxID=2721164 RepID=UPI0015529D72|nr:4-hydroxyphenylacetate 3-hydroxylase N-terminal domain-containing protein [Pseudoruegeria sp. HB172150]
MPRPVTPGTDSVLKTGEEYKESLKDGRQLWVNGKKLDTVFDEPALAGGIDIMASMFDDQFTEQYGEATTTFDEKLGKWVGRSWQEPKTPEELVARRKMIEYTSEKTAGVFGRPPDLAPTIAIGIASLLDRFKGAKSAFDECQPDFAENVARYIEYGRENTITAAESLTGPQNDRTHGHAQAASLLQVKKISKDGVWISGAKSVGSVAAQSNEIIFTNLGYPDTPPEAKIWGASPINAEGIKLVSREMLSNPGADPFDHPINHKGEEADQLVVFDNVFVPKERIFNLGDASLWGLAGEATLWAHWHVLTRLMVKSEIYVGCAQLVTEVLGTGHFPGVQGVLGEIIEFNRAIRAFILAAEANADQAPNGTMRPDVTMITAGRLYTIRQYPYIVHQLQEICGQGLVMRFGKNAFENPEIGHHLAELLPGRDVTGMQKEALMNFIWDLTGSSLAGRVALFENVNAAPAPRLRERLFREFDRTEMVNRVKRMANLDF